MPLYGFTFVILVCRLAYEAGHLLQEEVLSGTFDQAVGMVTSLQKETRGMSKAEVHSQGAGVSGVRFDYAEGCVLSDARDEFRVFQDFHV